MASKQETMLLLQNELDKQLLRNDIARIQAEQSTEAVLERMDVTPESTEIREPTKDVSAKAKFPLVFNPDIPFSDFNQETGLGIDELRAFRNDPRSVDKFGFGAVPGMSGALAGVGLGGSAGFAVGGPVGAAIGVPVGGMLGFVAGEELQIQLQRIEDFIDFPTSRKPISEQFISKKPFTRLNPKTGKVETVTPSKTESNASQVERAVVEAFTETTQRAAQTAGIDAGIQSGVTMLQRSAYPFFKAMGKLTGVTGKRVEEEVTSLMMDARRLQINLGAIDFGSQIARFGTRVVGVLPFIGAPARKEAFKKELQIDRKVKQFLDDIYPHTDPVIAGNRIEKGARILYKRRARIADRAYLRMWDTFEKHGNPNVIDTAPLKAAAQKLLGVEGAIGARTKGLPRTAEVVRPKVGVGPLRGPATIKTGEASFSVYSKEFEKELGQFLNLTKTATPSQMRQLQRNLNAAGRARQGGKMAQEELGAIHDIRVALNNALQSPQTLARAKAAGIEEPAIAEMNAAIKMANNRWSEMRVIGESVASRVVKRYDANLFKAGYDKPGTIEIDELATMYTQQGSAFRSPQFVADFEALAGRGNRLQLARNIVQKSFNFKPRSVPFAIEGNKLVKGQSQVFEFNANQVKTNLGLVDGAEGKMSRATLDKLLEGSGINRVQLERFLNLAERTQAVATTDASAFLSRRIILTGKATAVIGVGAAATTGEPIAMVSVGAFILTARGFNSLLSTPKGLQLLREGMKQNMGRRELAVLAGRVSALVGPEFQAQITE